MMLAPLILAAGLAMPPAPPCRPARIAATIDGRDGDFDGMSHGGTRLVLHNRGRAACTLPRLPQIGFTDARGRTLPVARRVPPGLHPGPVMVPIRLEPGAAAATDLRWVTGEVYDHSRCVRAGRVTLRLAGGPIRAPLVARMCGEAGQPIGIDQTPLAPMP